MVARVDKLNLPSYTGFVMPKLTPVTDADGAITDVTISYPLDLTTQMLEYSARQEIRRRPACDFSSPSVSLVLLSAPAAAQGQQDFSKVEIATTKISNNFVALDGQGGRIGVLYGPDGIFMVDSQFAPLSDKIMAAIRKVSDQKIRFLVNTHVHGDHTGGNENFGKAGATIVARPMLKQRLIKPNPPANGGPAPAGAPAAAGPRLRDRRAHADDDGRRDDRPDSAAGGAHRRRHRGEVREERRADDGRRVPLARLPQHRSRQRRVAQGHARGVRHLIAAAGPNTKVLPGHGPITNRAGIIAHKRMALALRDQVAKMIAQGKTQEQIVAAKITNPYEKQTGNAAGTGDRFVGQLVAELKASS